MLLDLLSPRQFMKDLKMVPKEEVPSTSPDHHMAHHLPSVVSSVDGQLLPILQPKMTKRQSSIPSELLQLNQNLETPRSVPLSSSQPNNRLDMLPVMPLFKISTISVKNQTPLLSQMKLTPMFLHLIAEDSSNIMDQLTSLHSEEELNLSGTSQIVKESLQQEVKSTLDGSNILQPKLRKQLLPSNRICQFNIENSFHCWKAMRPFLQLDLVEPLYGQTLHLMKPLPISLTNSKLKVSSPTKEDPELLPKHHWPSNQIKLTSSDALLKIYEHSYENSE